VFSHHGASVPATFQTSTADPGGLPGSYSSGAVSLVSGEQLTFQPGAAAIAQRQPNAQLLARIAFSSGRPAGTLALARQQAVSGHKLRVRIVTSLRRRTLKLTGRLAPAPTQDAFYRVVVSDLTRPSLKPNVIAGPAEGHHVVSVTLPFGKIGAMFLIKGNFRIAAEIGQVITPLNGVSTTVESSGTTFFTG
jgi:hypothetical protein